MEEIWKDVPDYEGLYQVSNFGRVKSFKRNKIIILKLTVYKNGYVCVSLTKNGLSLKRYVHQLVAMAFLGHKRCGLQLVVDHINDNKIDNRLENLQIVTQRYNSYKTQGKYSSKLKGVYFRKDCNKWQCQIEINKKNTYLGLFENEYDAHLAYQNALKNLEQ